MEANDESRSNSPTEPNEPKESAQKTEHKLKEEVKDANQSKNKPMNALQIIQNTETRHSRMKSVSRPLNTEIDGRRLTRLGGLRPTDSQTFQRRVSNFGAREPLSGRTSVSVRKSSVHLTKFDEGMPVGGGARRVSMLGAPRNSQLLGSSRNPSRRMSHMSRRSVIPIETMNNPISENIQFALEEDGHMASKSKQVNDTVKRISDNIKNVMESKEEESMKRISRLMWIFWVITLVACVLSIVSVLMEFPLWARIGFSCLKVLSITLLYLIPRKILSSTFKKSLAKTQRFQNLQNVFIQKEIRDFNKELENHAFD